MSDYTEHLLRIAGGVETYTPEEQKAMARQVLDNIEGVRLAVLLLARINHHNAPSVTPGPAHYIGSMELCTFPTCALFNEYLGEELTSG